MYHVDGLNLVLIYEAYEFAHSWSVHVLTALALIFEGGEGLEAVCKYSLITNLLLRLNRKTFFSLLLGRDVSLEFTALGRLPGTFIKWFLEELSHEGLCRLIDGKERGAIARCIFGYYDGQTETYFEGGMNGQVPEQPAGEGGYGWDAVFIPEGYSITRAELSPEDDHKTYMQIKPIEQVRNFLTS